MDVWTHPASAALRDAADEPLAAAAAALRARRDAGRRARGDSRSPHDSPSHGGSPKQRQHSPKQQHSPGGGRKGGRGSPRSAQPKRGSPRASPQGGKSRRTPSPADFDLGPAAAAPAVAQLHKLDVRALQKRARAVGVDEEELAKVIEGVRSFGRNGDAGSLGYSPKHALIDLIQAKAGASQQRRAAGTGASTAAAAPLPASALQKMGVRALRQRARDLGADEDELSEVVEGDSPKRGLITMIEALSSAPAAAAAAAGTEPQLEPQPPVTADAEPEPEPELQPQPQPQPQLESKPEPKPLVDGPSAIHSPTTSWRTARLVDQPTPEALRRSLEVLPPRLLAALQEVESVDVEVSSHASRSSGCTKGLRQLKQTYIADLLATLSQVEEALLSIEAMSHYRPADASPSSVGADGTALDATENGKGEVRPVSLLEGMAAELLQDRVLPSLSAVDLARLGQSCCTLLRLVRSAELSAVWEAHYSSRWYSRSSSGGSSSSSGGDSGDRGAALEYSHRANIEAAWRSTRWSELDEPHGGGGGGGGGLCCPQPQQLLPSTVETSSVLLQGPQHQICAISFDHCGRGNAATGDTDGLVRVWDVAQSLRGAKEQGQQNDGGGGVDGSGTRLHGRRAVGVESGLTRNAR
jgi:hypothetical protein